MNIGNRIKELRKARGITQEQLANSIGISFQAVSKWENNIALPDITLLPILASYFGITMDELFDYNLKEMQKKVIAIAKESWQYRRSKDWEKARSILEEGLKKYPNNDILLSNMLYVIDYEENPDEMIRIASKTVDVSKDISIKCDAYRFMAYAYKVKGDLEGVKSVLEQIPDITFSRFSEKANLLDGKEKFYAAGTQEGISLRTLLTMKDRLAEYFIEENDFQRALKEYEQALKVIETLEATKSWDWAREHFKERISQIKAKMDCK